MWFLFLVSTLPKNFPSTLPAIYGEPSLISLRLWHSIKPPGSESMCLPIGLGLWGSYSDIAHGLSFGHCLLLLLFSSPSWVLSKEQSSGSPDLMRFYSALSALLFIEVSRRRAHNWCSPEQMFFREGFRYCRQYLKYLLLRGKSEGRCWFFMDSMLSPPLLSK